MNRAFVRDGILFRAEALEATGLVRAAFTTRLGGISTGTRTSLNLSFTRGDDAVTVRENYWRAAQAFGCSPEALVLSRQPHGDLCEEVFLEEAGRRIVNDGLPRQRDAVMTDRPGLVLVTSHADCVPVYLLDPVHRAIAMVHAGWKGTSLRIAQKSLRAMARRYGTRSADVIAAVGPSIGPDAFEVQADVRAIFEDRVPEMDIVRTEDGRTTVDLWACNELQLREAGVRKANIHVARLCTAKHTDLFFSHRAEKGDTGTMAALFMLL
ncbi:MAG: peptidoglycan editing factor PgeF [Lachnospiraceae bacterium]|nr:peptidoglycan editing factor PgeF [Lachnospiraceae bacterium]